MVLGRAYQPPQRQPMDLACHHLETIWQEKKTRETSQVVERRPGQILERHDMAEDSTRQANLETACWGLPSPNHGCPMMVTMRMIASAVAIKTKKSSFYIAQYPIRWTTQRALHFLPSPDRPVHSNTNSAYLRRILAMQQICATTIHSHFHHYL